MSKYKRHGLTSEGPSRWAGLAVWPYDDVDRDGTSSDDASPPLIKQLGHRIVRDHDDLPTLQIDPALQDALRMQDRSSQAALGTTGSSGMHGFDSDEGMITLDTSLPRPSVRGRGARYPLGDGSQRSLHPQRDCLLPLEAAYMTDDQATQISIERSNGSAQAPLPRPKLVQFDNTSRPRTTSNLRQILLEARSRPRVAQSPEEILRKHSDGSEDDESPTSPSSTESESGLPPPVLRGGSIPLDTAGLVKATCMAIRSIWGDTTERMQAAGSDVPPNAALVDATGAAVVQETSGPNSVMPLPVFVKTILRRSRTTTSSLQCALLYLHRSREVLRLRARLSEEATAQLARYAADSALPDSGPNASTNRLSPTTIEILLRRAKDSMACGRRAFIAALMIATKFLQDDHCNNRVWSRITGVPFREMCVNERHFLKLMNYTCYIREDEFARCELLLIAN